MTHLLTLEDFQPLLHQTFRLQLEGLTLQLELVVAQALKLRPELARAPFALEFRGPMQPILSQRIYSLHYPARGTLDIFLVPIGPDEIGQRYEAVFN